MKRPQRNGRPAVPGRRKDRKVTRLDRLIEAATVDCHDKWEAIAGFHTMIEENLEVPFTTEVLGAQVTVEAVSLTDTAEIIAVCRRARFRQALPILYLPLPSPPPPGAEWIDAYRRWAQGR